VGDPVMVGAEVRYRIVRIAYDEPRDSLPDPRGPHTALLRIS
jgi:hypothetical protein